MSGLRGDLLWQQPRALSAPEPYTLVRDQSVSTDRSAIVAGQIVFSGGNLITQIGMQQILPSNARILIDKDEGTEWLMRMELPAVQAGRTVYSVNYFWIVAEQGCKPSFDATIYSSDATPFASHVDLEIQMNESTVPYREIAEKFMESHPFPD